jgi:DNA polymerase-3 subunit alpha
VEQIQILIRIDAFRFTGKSKVTLLWEALYLLGHKSSLDGAAVLFLEPPKPFALPVLTYTSVDAAWDELELLGFPVSLSYFDLLKTKYRGDVLAATMRQYTGQKVRMVGVLVTTKQVRTIRGELMQFGTFLDTNNDFFDTVNFPVSLKDWPFKGPGVYLLLGRITEEFGFPSMEVEKMDKLPFQEKHQMTTCILNQS